MSRSKPELNSTEIQMPVYGHGFKVGRSVCGCYLKKVSAEEKYHKGVSYDRVVLSFMAEDGQWMSKIISFLPPEAYDATEAYQEAKLNATACLENLCACYMSVGAMKNLFFSASYLGIPKLVEHIVSELKERRFWEKEICLKTLPNSDGGVSVARYAPFMAGKNETRWSLSYDSWEQGIYDKFKNNKK